MRKGEVRDAFPNWFERINPKLRVPAITVDDETVTEVPEIATLISQLAPEMGFMGHTPLQTVRVYEWLNYLSGTVHMAFGQALLRPHRVSDDPAALGSRQKRGSRSEAMSSLSSRAYMECMQLETILRF